MSYLKFNNKIITAPIEEILSRVRAETRFKYLHDTQKSHSGLRITCPFHAEGNEKTPDCFINDNPDSDLYGVFHCFACGAKGYITDIINYCFGEDGDFAEYWLVSNFATVFVEQRDILPKIELNNEKKKSYLDKSEINKYKYIHPYLLNRGISEEVIKKFSVGYDERDNSIVFPVWDDRDNLLFFTKRRVDKKQFSIPNKSTKPVYLLNFIKRNNITSVYVVESQINALTLWTWGYPAIALFGTGSKEQYEILNNSGVRNYILCFDGDVAGDKGAERFKKNINCDALVSVKKIPRGADVNDLTKDQFDFLEVD